MARLLFYTPQMGAYGGIESHVCRLTLAAAAAGHNVRLLTTSSNLGSALREGLVSSPRISFREMKTVGGKGGQVQKLLWLLKEVAIARTSQWKVIYTNGQSGLSKLVWWAGKRGTRIVHHHHNAADRFERDIWAASYKNVLRGVPAVVTCSATSKREIETYFGRNNVTFIPYLTNDLCPDGRCAPNRDGAQLHFGYIGRLRPEKGINEILRLSQDSQFSDIIWHIHGAGPEYPPEVFKGKGRVEYHGAYRSVEQLTAILQSLDAVCLFSTHHEGMPLSLIEAMSAGRPWVASDRGGVGELGRLAPDSVIITKPDSYEALRRGTLELKERMRSGRVSSTRQRQAYEKHFLPELVSARWLKYFDCGPTSQENPEHS